LAVPGQYQDVTNDLEKQVRERYRSDSDALIRLGVELAEQADDMPRIRVRIPRALAEDAVASWDWEEPEGYQPSADETCEQRIERGRSATLAMIGMTIQEEGVWREVHVEVELHPWHLGVTLEASDDAEVG
jgi:hypothetical protein